MREARFERRTKETKISARLRLEGSGRARIATPVPFFNHMLETFARHGLFDVSLSARGDTRVDQHHLIEDCGLVLGRVFSLALGDRAGINRTGFFVFPMDEALAVVAVDLGGRPYLQFEADFRRRFCGALDTDLLEDFFQALSVQLGANMVVRLPFGRCDHHKVEAAFKGLGKALRAACSLDIREAAGMPSAKGIIDHDWHR
ncbi:MAG: imidazoleglycerol-phosphate dehydratase [Candidatus Aminicenantes bacterium RBG_16_63_16]|nr:MAG: imidazoleglycerol-phosphate dehydratase [Candidatus Aminicenantes bacterium RBG_16_63_16]